MAFSKSEKNSIIIDSVAVLMGNTSINRKKAAILLLKAFLPHRIVQDILNEDGIHPFERNDPRVKAWTKRVLSKGACEVCGSHDDLEAHHIIRWAEYPAGRADLSNGSCLCHKCHTEEHKDEPSYFMMVARKK